MDDEFDQDVDIRMRAKVMHVQSLLVSGVAAVTLSEVDSRLDGLQNVLRTGAGDSTEKNGGAF